MKKDLTIETGMCYIRVGKPVVDGFIKASGSCVVLFSVPFDGDVLVSLDVNGTAVARRELFKMVEGSIAVGDYTVAYANDAVTISTTENNDLVHIRIEPVEVVVSDALRAAVKRAIHEQLDAPSDNRFIVTFSYDETTETWITDKTFDECAEAWTTGKNLYACESGIFVPLTCVTTESDVVTYIDFTLVDPETSAVTCGYGIDASGAYYYGT